MKYVASKICNFTIERINFIAVSYEKNDCFSETSFVMCVIKTQYTPKNPTIGKANPWK